MILTLFPSVPLSTRETIIYYHYLKEGFTSLRIKVIAQYITSNTTPATLISTSSSHQVGVGPENQPHVAGVLDDHPARYYPRSTLLNISDRMEPVAYNAIKRLTRESNK